MNTVSENSVEMTNLDANGYPVHTGCIVIDKTSGADGGIVLMTGDHNAVVQYMDGDIFSPQFTDLIVIHDFAKEDDEIRPGAIVIIDGPRVARVVRVDKDADSAIIDILYDASSQKRLTPAERTSWHLDDCEVVG